MDDNTISVSISDEEREFVDGQIAAGTYADDQEVVRAGLAALERQERIRELRKLIAEGDEDIRLGNVFSYDSTEEFLRDIASGQDDLPERLAESESSGISARKVPDILADVKAKLRANGSL